MRRFAGAACRLAVLTAALLAFAALAAGCHGEGDGGDERAQEEYQQGLNAVGEDLQRELGRVLRKRPASIVDIDNQARERAGVLRRASARLEKLEPPAEAEDGHEKLVAGLRALAEDRTLVLDVRRRGRRYELAPAAEESRELQEARRALEDEGYDVDPILGGPR